MKWRVSDIRYTPLHLGVEALISRVYDAAVVALLLIAIILPLS